MKLIRTEDAVGSVLCHDITQIIPGVVKDAVFRKDYPGCGKGRGVPQRTCSYGRGHSCPAFCGERAPVRVGEAGRDAP